MQYGRDAPAIQTPRRRAQRGARPGLRERGPFGPPKKGFNGLAPAISKGIEPNPWSLQALESRRFAATVHSCVPGTRGQMLLNRSAGRPGAAEWLRVETLWAGDRSYRTLRRQQFEGQRLAKSAAAPFFNIATGGSSVDQIPPELHPLGVGVGWWAGLGEGR